MLIAIVVGAALVAVAGLFPKPPNAPRDRGTGVPPLEGALRARALRSHRGAAADADPTVLPDQQGDSGPGSES